MKKTILRKTTEQQSKVKPSIHNIPGSKWGWVKLNELAGIIGIEANSLWRDYFYMSRSRYTLQTAIELADSWVLQERERSEAPDSKEVSSILVPAGWSDDVLTARELGIIRVIDERHFHQDPFPGEWVDPKDECIAGAINCLHLGTLTINKAAAKRAQEEERKHHESDIARGCLTARLNKPDDGKVRVYSAAIGLDAQGNRVVYRWNGCRNDGLGDYTSTGTRFRYEVVIEK